MVRVWRPHATQPGFAQPLDMTSLLPLPTFPRPPATGSPTLLRVHVAVDGRRQEMRDIGCQDVPLDTGCDPALVPTGKYTNARKTQDVQLVSEHFPTNADDAPFAATTQGVPRFEFLRAPYDGRRAMPEPSLALRPLGSGDAGLVDELARLQRFDPRPHPPAIQLAHAVNIMVVLAKLRRVPEARRSLARVESLARAHPDALTELGIERHLPVLRFVDDPQWSLTPPCGPA